jgi:glycosyltransferase involved in cell wall biosynthesis
MNQSTNNQPLVSVLMPAYNAGEFISESIESIQSQTYRNWELLILDDHSTDQTLDTVRAAAHVDPRISMLVNTSNQGISKSRNRLIASARGTYIAWQDADDYSYPNRLELQVAFLEKHPEVGICGGSLDFFDGTAIFSQRTYPCSDAEIRTKLFRYSPVAQPAAMARLAVVRQVGGFDESLPQAEDLDLSLRIGQVAQFANLREPLLQYRYFAGSVTRKKLKENINATVAVRLRAYRVYHYPMSLTDKGVLAVTWLFQFVPGWITYPLFNLLRNSN